MTSGKNDPLTDSDTKMSFYKKIAWGEPRIDLESIKGPLSEAAATHIRENIPICSEMLADVNRDLWLEELQRVLAEVEIAKQRREETQSRLTQAEQDQVRIPSPSFLRLVVCSVCAQVALASEFAFTWSVLPVVLNVPQKSLWGVALGAMPVAATAVIELLFDRLFRAIHTLKRWGKFSWADRISFTLRSVVYACLFTFLSIMILKLSGLRAAALEILRSLMDLQGAESVNLMALGPAIDVLSLGVVYATALIFRQVLKDGRHLFRSWMRRRRVMDLRTELDNRRRVHEEAMSRLKPKQQIWEESSQRSELIAKAMTTRDLFELQQIQDRKPEPLPEPSLEQVVAQVLSPRFPPDKQKVNGRYAGASLLAGGNSNPSVEPQNQGN